jgi:hypothetical protein
MAVLSREQVDAFGRDGYLTAEDAVTPKQPKSASFFTVLGQDSKQAAE